MPDFVSPSNARFRILNAGSGTALDKRGDDHVIGYEPNDGVNQKWEVQQHSDGKWTFRNIANGKYLAVEGGQAEDNKTVIVTDEPYEWYMNVDSHLSSNDRGFRIYAHPCFNLDLDGGKTENNTRVSVWGQWTEEQGAAPHQSWRFVRD